jgi:transposase-like protein
MRRYSEAVKADVRRRMSPPHRQSVARISEELGIHVITLYKWRKAWRLQGEVGRHPRKTLMAGVLPTSSRWCLRPLG